MPFTQDSKDLPQYVKNRSESVRKKWILIFNLIAKSDSEETAFVVANTWLKKQVKEKIITARTSNTIERITFEIDDRQLIKRTDGEEYVSFKLADVFKDKFGVALPENVLQKWADMINTNPLVGDIDHQEYDYWLAQGLNEDQIKERLKNKKGIAKTVQAIFDKGRLWVRAIVDKRYRETIRKSKGVSLEAIISRDNSGNIEGADLLGFTFGVNQNPVIEGTELNYGKA